MGAASWVISTPLRKRETVASELSALSVLVKMSLATVLHLLIILTAQHLLLHRLDHTHLQGWLGALAKMVENGQFEGKRDPLLSGEHFATLHQEGQKMHAKDIVQFWPQCRAALDIVLALIHLCCCSVQKTSPEWVQTPQNAHPFPKLLQHEDPAPGCP